MATTITTSDTVVTTDATTAEDRTHPGGNGDNEQHTIPNDVVDVLMTNHPQQQQEGGGGGEVEVEQQEVEQQEVEQQEGGASKASSSSSVSTSTSSSSSSLPLQRLPTITFMIKYKKERFIYSDLPGSMTIGQIKQQIQQETHLLPIRQKLIGLTARIGGTKGVTDDLPISELLVKSNTTTTTTTVTTVTTTNNSNNNSVITHQFILMGTPEEQIFIDPCDKEDLPDIMDDFDFDFHAGSDEWVQHHTNETNLKQFTQQTPIHIMNEPRLNKPLLVLDLDHTLLDFSSKSLLQQHQQPSSSDSSTAAVIAAAVEDISSSSSSDTLAERMKRPYMDEFLSQCYQHYDMVIWSQTSWRWLETKLIELNMISHPGYKFCFVLDKVRVVCLFVCVGARGDLLVWSRILYYIVQETLFEIFSLT